VASVHVVVRDDNLWVIAAARLERAGGPADDVAIARYWRRVISRNQARLRSGDPNLIFPGEVIWLPPVDRAG
jgi:nucleoid-associated protein YgaU